MIKLSDFAFGAAVFDLDGTLFDSMGFWNDIDVRFLSKRGIDTVPEDYLLAIAHLGAEETAKYTRERFGLTETAEEMMAEWHEEAVRYYSTSVTLKPGALEYITVLHGRGIKLGIATASSEELYIPALDHLSIRSLFSSFAAVGECERKKGFPDVYELACERMGADKANTAVFEDIYIAICGAKDGGFYTVGVYDSSSDRDRQLIREKADAYIESFTELL